MRLVKSFFVFTFLIGLNLACISPSDKIDDFDDSIHVDLQKSMGSNLEQNESELEEEKSRKEKEFKELEEAYRKKCSEFFHWLFSQKEKQQKSEMGIS